MMVHLSPNSIVSWIFLPLQPRGFTIAIGLAVQSLGAIAADAPKLRDIDNHWAGTCIARLAQLKQVHGYPEGMFRPEARVTRAEFAALIVDRFPPIPTSSSYDGSPQSAPVANPGHLFGDVPRNHWAYGAIESAYRTRIFVGYPDRTFRPNQPIARVEALSILGKLVSSRAQAREQDQVFADLPAQVLKALFEDVATIPAWSQPAIAAAATAFVVVDAPQGRRLRPMDQTTRAEATAFLCQAQGFDGLVPPEAVVGNQYFTWSPELKKLQIAKMTSPSAWFDTKREVAVLTSLPSDPNHDQQSGFSEGLRRVYKDDKYGFEERSGAIVIPIKFNYVNDFREGLALVGMLDKETFITTWSFIDKTGNLVIPAVPAASVQSFSDGLARIEVTGSGSFSGRKYGFIDRSGQIVIEPIFSEAAAFSEGISPVAIYGGLNSRYGYIDKAGQWVIHDLTSLGGSFSEGLAAVSRTGDHPDAGGMGGYGYIDRGGKWVIPPQIFSSPEISYLKAHNRFTQGFAIVRIGDRMAVIDRQGKVVLPPHYSDIAYISNGYAYANYGGTTYTYLGGYDGSATPFSETGFGGGRWGYVKLNTPK
jgi:S-layer homology domain/WG containing repeat